MSFLFSVLLVSVLRAHAADMFFDNEDRGVEIKEASLSKYPRCGCAGGAHMEGFHHDNPGPNNMKSSLTWRFTVPQDGCYKISEWHPGLEAQYCAGMFTTGAKLEMANGVNTTSIEFDTSIKAGRWNPVGKYPFYADKPGYIRASKPDKKNCPSRSCYWTADGFRFTWMSEVAACGSVMLSTEQMTAETMTAETMTSETMTPTHGGSGSLETGSMVPQESTHQATATTTSTPRGSGFMQGSPKETMQAAPPGDDIENLSGALCATPYSPTLVACCVLLCALFSLTGQK